MNRRGKKVRRWIGAVARWGGLALCLAFTAAAAMNFRNSVLWESPWLPGQIRLSGMCLGGGHTIALTDERPSSRITGEIWLTNPMGWRMVWAAPSVVYRRNIVSTYAHLAIWMPDWMWIAATAIPTALLWCFRPRRNAPNHCRCGYDLAGLPAAASVCPECGRAIGAKGAAA